VRWQCTLPILHATAATTADVAATSVVEPHTANPAPSASSPQAVKRRLPVSVETCPHYLLFESEKVPDGATQFKCAPPIRGAANRARLIEAVLAGDIEIVSSDHSPAPPDMKELDSGDFMKAWGGISGVCVCVHACVCTCVFLCVRFIKSLGWRDHLWIVHCLLHFLFLECVQHATCNQRVPGELQLFIPNLLPGLIPSALCRLQTDRPAAHLCLPSPMICTGHATLMACH
jgi:hypothetical protein